MYNNRKRKIEYYIDRISAVCGILSFIIANIKWFDFIPYTEHFTSFIVKYKSILLVLLITIIILRYIICVIPNYKIYLEEKPKPEANPSIISISITILISTTVMLYLFIHLDNTTLSSKADNITPSENDQMEKIEEVQFEDEYLEYNNKENILTEEDKSIEKYIKMAHDEIISKDILKTLSFNDLYYIRNGIFAYEGFYFESGYYERFSWYNGNITSEEEIWCELNAYQYTNIQNIKKIEEKNE